MKRILLLSLSLTLGISAFAQQRIAKNDIRQFTESAADRGTGYNFYNDGEWGLMPESRLEEFRTGWPSIAPWKDGEILLCHSNSHMECFVRDIAGEGEWRYMGSLPDYPEDYPYPTEYPSWPRVVTCGDNHNVIIVVGALQHQVSSDETHSHTVMWRSEDAENWTVSYGPLADLGLGYEVDNFSADDYCLAANGHTVALLYSGCLTNSTWMFKSTDDGLTWEPTKVWEHPFEGRSLDEIFDYGDSLYIPMNSAITIDNNGVAHVALNTLEMTHTLDNEPKLPSKIPITQNMSARLLKSTLPTRTRSMPHVSGGLSLTSPAMSTWCPTQPNGLVTSRCTIPTNGIMTYSITNPTIIPDSMEPQAIRHFHATHSVTFVALSRHPASDASTTMARTTTEASTQAIVILTLDTGNKSLTTSPTKTSTSCSSFLTTSSRFLPPTPIPLVNSGLVS